MSANGASASALVLGALPRSARLTVHSNVLAHGAHGVKGGGTTAGRLSLAAYASNALFTRNVIVGGGNERDYPPENYFTSSLRDVGFADVARGDYRLVTPAYRGSGIDGRDIGADVEQVERLTRGAVVVP